MSTDFKHIVRLINKDLDGTLNVDFALTHVKGIGIRLADSIVKRAGISSHERLGFLSESEIEKLEEIVRNIDEQGIPSWLMNRRKDLETGGDIHLISSDLDLRIKSDVEMLKDMRSWRGYRHAYGLKVRGQRTKTTGRTGKTLGVKKKTLQRPAAPPKSEG